MEIIQKIVELRASNDFDPANPDHARILSRAFQELGDCKETMTLLIGATGGTTGYDIETLAGLRGAREWPS